MAKKVLLSRYKFPTQALLGLLGWLWMVFDRNGIHTPFAYKVSILLRGSLWIIFLAMFIWGFKELKEIVFDAERRTITVSKWKWLRVKIFEKAYPVEDVSLTVVPVRKGLYAYPGLDLTTPDDPGISLLDRLDFYVNERIFYRRVCKLKDFLGCRLVDTYKP